MRNIDEGVQVKCLYTPRTGVGHNRCFDPMQFYIKNFHKHNGKSMCLQQVEAMITILRGQYNEQTKSAARMKIVEIIHHLYEDMSDRD